jgi:hypothetical protein
MPDTLPPNKPNKKVSLPQSILLSAIGVMIVVLSIVGVLWQGNAHKMQILEKKIAALQQQRETLPTQAPQPLEDLAALREKIVRLRADVDALNTRPLNTLSTPTASPAVSSVMTIFAVAFLRDQFNKGTPFSSVYQSVTTILHDNGIFAETPALAAASISGMPTRTALASQFDDIMKKPVVLIDAPSSLLGKTLSSLFQIKKTYAHDQPQKNSVIEVAQALQRDDMQRALSEIERLPQELRQQQQLQQQLQDWAADLKKRQAVLQELDALDKQAAALMREQQHNEKQPSLSPAP